LQFRFQAAFKLLDPLVHVVDKQFVLSQEFGSPVERRAQIDSWRDLWKKVAAHRISPLPRQP
jgi:hypothetical protein